MQSRYRNLIECLNVVEVETRRFVLDNEDLEKVSQLLLEEFKNGLSETIPSHACLKMVLTYIRDVPNGKEQGKYLTVELDKSILSILYIDLNSNSSQINIRNELYEISNTLRKGPGQQLFDYIAECLKKFIVTLKLENQYLPLGFVFKFPCTQSILNNATLLRWTKGFSCSDVIGKDVGQLLRKAMVRKGVTKVDLIAVVNDSTDTLMSCAYKNKNCHIGLIIGEGTNACYMENLDNIKKWTKSDKNQPHQMIINIEWGAFGDNNCLNFIRTKYDIMVDNKSINPKEQIFEKMISGMYLGELVRTILIDFINCELLFNGNISDELKTAYSFNIEWLKAITNDVVNNRITETQKVLKTINLNNVSKEDCEIVKVICNRVIERSAFLISAALAAILNKLKRPETIIGVDGSLYHSFPSYKILLETKTKELTSPQYKFELISPEYASGVGAALVVAVACKSWKQ